MFFSMLLLAFTLLSAILAHAGDPAFTDIRWNSAALETTFSAARSGASPGAQLAAIEWIAKYRPVESVQPLLDVVREKTQPPAARDAAARVLQSFASQLPSVLSNARSFSAIKAAAVAYYIEIQVLLRDEISLQSDKPQELAVRAAMANFLAFARLRKESFVESEAGDLLLYIDLKEGNPLRREAARTLNELLKEPTEAHESIIWFFTEGLFNENEKASSAIARLMNADADEEIRFAMADAVAQLCQRRLAGPAEEVAETNFRAMRLTNAYLSALFQSLGDGSARVRGRALDALAALKELRPTVFKSSAVAKAVAERVQQSDPAFGARLRALLD